MKLHILIVILVFGFSVLGQTSKESCNLTIKDSPALHGIKLRMTSEEVSKALSVKVSPAVSKTTLYLTKVGDEYKEARPTSLEERNKAKKEIEIGESRFRFQRQLSNSAPLSPVLEGVDSLYLSFYKNVLYGISIDYKKDLQGTSLKEFIYKTSNKLNLPVNAWLIEGQLAHFFCSGFTMLGHSIGSNTLTLTLSDDNVSEEVRKTAKEKIIEREKQ